MTGRGLLWPALAALDRNVRDRRPWGGGLLSRCCCRPSLRRVICIRVCSVRTRIRRRCIGAAYQRIWIHISTDSAASLHFYGLQECQCTQTRSGPFSTSTIRTTEAIQAPNFESHPGCRRDRFLHRDWANWPNPVDRQGPPLAFWMLRHCIIEKLDIRHFFLFHRKSQSVNLEPCS